MAKFLKRKMCPVWPISIITFIPYFFMYPGRPSCSVKNRLLILRNSVLYKFSFETALNSLTPMLSAFLYIRSNSGIPFLFAYSMALQVAITLGYKWENPSGHRNKS
jgi:hypothetical protein